MKDIDLAKEYVIPSPGYRNVRERSIPKQHEEQDGLKYRQDMHKVRSYLGFHPSPISYKPVWQFVEWHTMVALILLCLLFPEMVPHTLVIGSCTSKME